jgi:hypothetical protein
MLLLLLLLLLLLVRKNNNFVPRLRYRRLVVVTVIVAVVVVVAVAVVKNDPSSISITVLDTNIILCTKSNKVHVHVQYINWTIKSTHSKEDFYLIVS